MLPDRLVVIGMDYYYYYYYYYYNPWTSTLID